MLLTWLRFIPFSKRLLLVLILGCMMGTRASAQERIGFFMPDGVNMVEIKFEQYSNLIVIPITINNFLTLKFILDTGAESAILTEKVFGDILGLTYVRDIQIQGPGLIDSLQAFVATGIRMSMPGGIQGKGLNMLVLKEDYLELNKNLGEEIYGIIGYEVFNRFVINIDYDERILRIYRPESFKPRKWDTAIPMTVYNTKPFINMQITQDGKKDTVKLMVDSGASHALLLDVDNTDDLKRPEKVILTRLGHGLGGEIPGHLGRMNTCLIGDFSFEDVLVSIPISGAYIKAIKRGSRHGTLGGDLLSRFDVTFDYPNETLYLRKGRTFNDTFEANMSGMIIAAEGKKLDSLVVSDVNEDTPATEVDIRRGDVILKINGLNLQNSSVSEINAMLRKKDGLKIRLVIWRDGRKMKKTFRLKRMI